MRTPTAARIRPRRTAWLLLWALSFPATVVRAEPPAEPPLELSVSAGPGSETCPDSRALRARVEALRGASASPLPRAFQVAFARVGARFEATLRARDLRTGSESVRVLRAPSDSCRGVAEATAITLSLLLDAELPESPPGPEPAALEAREPEQAPAPPRSAPSRHARLRALGALGAAVIFGLTRPTLPALSADAGLELAGYRLTLGALWSPPHERALGPGKLRQSLASGTLRLCVPAHAASLFQLHVCSGAHVGAFQVRASGYTRNQERTRLWLAAPLELVASLGSGALRVELALGAIFTAHPPDFTVSGVAAGYRSWGVSPVLAVRVLALAPK